MPTCPPRLVKGLQGAGYDARHVHDIGLLKAADIQIFDRAANGGDVLITADTDFSMLLAARGSAGLSVVLWGHVAELPWRDHKALLVENLPAVLADLQDGAVVSLNPTRLAVRRLPIVGGPSPPGAPP